jgi:hypothetical protein
MPAGVMLVWFSLLWSLNGFFFESKAGYSWNCPPGQRLYSLSDAEVRQPETGGIKEKYKNIRLIELTSLYLY